MRVLRLLLRPALAILSFCAMLLLGYVGLLHARPYDDGGLRDFLLPPDGCAAPCWAGIRPGVTTVDEALLLLDAHEWIITPRLSDNFDRSNGWGAIYWTWNDQQPSYIAADRLSYLSVRNGIVEQVALAMKASYGQIFLTLGEPLLWTHSSISVDSTAQHSAIFANQLVTQTTLHCPVTPAALSRSVVKVMVNNVQAIVSPQKMDTVEVFHQPPC